MKQKTSMLILAFLLCFIGTANAQGPTKPKLCSTCGKMVVNCPYKGNHPKCVTCGKLKEKCAYKGNHPKCATCGKVKESCPYNGKHPKPQIQPVIESQEKNREKEQDMNSSEDQVHRLIKNLEANMVYVDGGAFMMGTDEGVPTDVFGDIGKPVHQVTLSSFYICKYEVTQDLWEAVMGSNPSEDKGALRPVEQVDWNDCQIFINKLNALTGKHFRLPTEAEWEFSARGGNLSKNYKFAGSNNLSDVACLQKDTYNVGLYKANELGLFDMSGNVFEWCSDLFGRYPANHQLNPTGPTTETSLKISGKSYRIIRGGCLYFEKYSRCVYRTWTPDDNKWSYLGLRLAMDP